MAKKSGAEPTVETPGRRAAKSDPSLLAAPAPLRSKSSALLDTRSLQKTGSFYYHCDWHASHYVKVMRDQIFEENNSQNEYENKPRTGCGITQTRWRQFHASNGDLGFFIKDFWMWSASDLVSNVTRGHLAEFIVAKAIGAAEVVTGMNGQPTTLQHQTGQRLKNQIAAYLQSWPQDDYSTIQFNVEKTMELALKDGRYRGTPCRHADVYVFALLAHKDKQTVDPLNVNQWDFYVLPMSVLDKRTRSQHSITLKTLDVLSGWRGRITSI